MKVAQHARCMLANAVLCKDLAACHGMHARQSLPFDLAAKVCMPWGVDRIQRVFAVLKRGVL